ncbi:MAG TPA: hypothetical protein VFK26_02570 [Gemmatimonadaceae bacterium]|jgi:hypothetical protein|nr:hypothetical protein [Gemmatimonadaceae bacterium]
MKMQLSRAGFLVAMMTVASIAAACNRDADQVVKGRSGPGGTSRDTVSDITLSEDGIGPIQIGMNLSDAVNMGLLNDNPNRREQCDWVYPAVGSGIPDGVNVMVVNGKIARIDVDTGTVTTEDGGKIGDSEDRIKSIYGDDLTIEPHKYIEGGHYMTVAGDSASAGKAIVFETDGKQVTAFRAGRLPEVKWVEGCS